MNEFNKRAFRRSKPLSLSEAKSRYPEYRYAVCNVRTGAPVCLCETLETAKKAMEDAWKFGGERQFVLDLGFDLLPSEIHDIRMIE